MEKRRVLGAKYGEMIRRSEKDGGGEEDERKEEENR